MIFYQPGMADLGNELTLSSDVETIVMLVKKENGFELSVSDPTHEQMAANLSINKNLKGRGVSYPKHSATQINFDFPMGDYRGNAVSRFYEWVPTKR